MFKANMIAPCGLDCNICSQALIEHDPCQGCNGPDEHKPEFCSKYCGIILCRKRKENGYKYCDECPDYPCEDVMEKETRYTTKYPHRESPLEKLRMIRTNGMEAFLEQEKKAWTCPNCGKPFSVQTGIVRTVEKDLIVFENNTHPESRCFFDLGNPYRKTKTTYQLLFRV